MTSPLGFKARVGSALFAIFAEANVMYIPQDSPLVLHLPTSWRPARSRSLPHMHVQRWDLAQFRTCNRTNRRRTRYHCASDPARRLDLKMFSFSKIYLSSHNVFLVTVLKRVSQKQSYHATSRCARKKLEIVFSDRKARVKRIITSLGIYSSVFANAY